MKQPQNETLRNSSIILVIYCCPYDKGYMNLLDLPWLNRFLYVWVLKWQISVIRFLHTGL